jgi:uncharacterized membrane protein YkvA (DUF1232 family)
MPKRSLRAESPRSPTRKRRPALPGGKLVLTSADLRAILLDLASQLAPGDLTTLMGHEQELRARAAQLTLPSLSLFRKQLDLAFGLLRDHADGACPQIPYYTITLIAAAVYYFAAELDVIPDFLPRVGPLDDAAVMAMACRLADAGLRRYATWKGLATDSVLDSRSPRRPSAGPA